MQPANFSPHTTYKMDYDSAFGRRYSLSRSGTPLSEPSGTPSLYPTLIPPASEYSNDERLSLSARSESPYYNHPPYSANALPEFHMSNYLRRPASLGSGHSNQSHRSSINSDWMSSGSTRQNDPIIQELQMEVALLRSENQAIKAEKETITYVIVQFFFLIKC